jgi:hypothetical protein
VWEEKKVRMRENPLNPTSFNDSIIFQGDTGGENEEKEAEI